MHIRLESLRDIVKPNNKFIVQWRIAVKRMDTPVFLCSLPLWSVSRIVEERPHQAWYAKASLVASTVYTRFRVSLTIFYLVIC